MIPSQVDRRLSLLADFRQEFKSVYIQLCYYAEFYLPIAPEVLASYGELSPMGAALIAVPYPDTLSLPNRGISLDQWADRTKRYWRDEKKAQRWLTIPEHLQLVHIRENKEISYWSRILSIIDMWWTARYGQLEDVAWTLEPGEVEVIVRGKGAFNAIRPVAIEGVDQALWSVDVSPGSSGVPEGAQYAVMLGAQYLAQQGGGRLAGEMSGDQVEMQLHIPRADTDEAILKSWPLQPEIAGRIVDEILHVIADGMRKGSQKLDQALSEEIDRLANEKVDLEALGNLRKSLDKLRETERLFDDYWRALL